MQKVHLVIICIIGLLSAAFGFAAAATQTKVRDGKIINGECIYPSSPSFGLAIVAVLLLLLEQVVIEAYAGWLCCRTPCPGPYGTQLHGVLAATWVFTLFSLLLLMKGALYQLNFDSSPGGPKCDAAQDEGYLIAGNFIGMVNPLLQIAYYFDQRPNISGDDIRYNQQDRSLAPDQSEIMMTNL